MSSTDDGNSSSSEMSGTELLLITVPSVIFVMIPICLIVAIGNKMEKLRDP